MSEIILVLLFVASAAAGYRLIRGVPPLLHTPLMSGMNAFSGITVTGAIAATAAAVALSSKILGVAAVFLAVINVAGGFVVTGRMLRMFRSGKKR